MKKQKAYKFRLYPNLEQRILFEKTFGCSRFIWNQMLADRIAHYEKTGESLKNTPAQYKEKFPWLKEVDSLALCNVQLNLNKAYKSFFQSGFGFPKFKSKRAATVKVVEYNEKSLTIETVMQLFKEVIGVDDKVKTVK